MSPAGTLARRWTCERCEMSIGRIDGGRVTMPESWASTEGGLLCLACRRERAAEVALDAVPEESTRDTRVKVRRAGLIEFEVRREPDRPDNAIAKACHSSPSAVAAARRRLEQVR